MIFLKWCKHILTHPAVSDRSWTVKHKTAVHIEPSCYLLKLLLFFCPLGLNQMQTEKKKTFKTLLIFLIFILITSLVLKMADWVFYSLHYYLPFLFVSITWKLFQLEQKGISFWSFKMQANCSLWIKLLMLPILVTNYFSNWRKLGRLKENWR